MTSFFIDAGIFLLLAISVGFAGIGIIGLLVFPDIRSRMYTATRATVIGMCSMMLAGLLYAVTTFSAGGGESYLLLFDIVILLLIIIVANGMIYRLILKRIKTAESCGVSSAQGKTGE
jgi:multisubunit Na+/H+ antiporter MnhG subunit